MEQNERPALSREILQRFLEFKGLKFNDERLERIMPRVQRYLDNINSLEEVDISEAEPAVIFLMKPEPDNER